MIIARFLACFALAGVLCATPALAGPPTATNATYIVNGKTVTVASIGTTTFPAAATTFAASGYNTAGDGGGGEFILVSSCTADTGTCLQDAKGQYWQRLLVPGQPLNGVWFGMVGNDTVDNATYANNWLSAMKAQVKKGWLPNGTYKTTQSLNATFASNSAQGNQSFCIEGESELGTVIDGQLTEQYPILDMSGASYACLKNLTITTNSSSTSQATTALLIAKGTSDGVGTGNGVTLDHVLANVATSGNSYAAAGAVIYNSDLPQLTNVGISGPIGLSIGWNKPSTVTSKFQTLPSALDFTDGFVNASQFSGSSGCALLFTGGAALTGVRDYAALVGTGGGAAPVCVNEPSETAGDALWFYSLRTENQSSATGKAAIYWYSKTNDGHIDGVLNPGSGGYDFAGASGFNLSALDINITGGATLFNLGGGINTSNVTVNGTLSGFGTISDLGTFSTFSNIWRLDGLSPATTLGAIGAQPCQNVSQNGGTALGYIGAACGLVSPVDVTHVITPGGVTLSEAVTPTAYTGGSGEQLVYSTTINTPALKSWSSYLTYPTYEYNLTGSLASAAASGRIRINLSQGGSNFDCLDTGANVPAGTTGSVALKVTIQNNASGSINLYTFCSVEVDPSSDTAGTPFQRFSPVLRVNSTLNPSTAITLNVYETNANNSPYGWSMERARIN